MKNPMESKPVFPLLMSMAVPPMVSMLILVLQNNSKRSTLVGSLGFFLVSGKISIGCPYGFPAQ